MFDYTMQYSAYTFVLILLTRHFVPTPITLTGAGLAFVKMYAIFFPIYVASDFFIGQAGSAVELITSSASLCALAVIIGIVVKELLRLLHFKKEDM